MWIRNMEKNPTMAFAAELAYYFVFTLLPFLVLPSAVVAHLPLPDFFSQVMGPDRASCPSHQFGPTHDLDEGHDFVQAQPSADIRHSVHPVARCLER